MNNPYLSGETTLLVSAETASKVDAEVLRIIKTCHQNAKMILQNNIDKLNELTKYLLEKETITGEVFMAILSGKVLELV